MDLKDAFHNIVLDEGSTQLTAFVTPQGQYEYLRLPFGICNSPSIFARYISELFRELIDQGKISIYLDDIMIATETVAENLDTLEQVFKVLVDSLVDLKMAKCSFLQSQIEYLGYVVSKDGIKPNPENIAAVLQYPIPNSAKQVQSFLGLASYFRRFVKNFSVVAKPLYDLIKKNAKFEFGAKQLQAIDYLKNELAVEPLLAIFSLNAETELHCDASIHGFGGILLQRQPDGKFHPVSYFSKRTLDCETRYTSYELECLAIVYAIKRFEIYLKGIRFKIVTDCNSIKQTFAKKEVIPRIMRWVLFLQDFEYTLEHRPGTRSNTWMR